MPSESVNKPAGRSRQEIAWRIIAVVAVVMLFVPTVIINRMTADDRYDAMDEGWLERVPAAEIALVLGAGLRDDGTPTLYLAWRVETAVKLYKAGKVRTLLMSGNAKNEDGSEPEAMRAYARRLGVKASDIVLDNAGYTTYESCYRVKQVFGYGEVIVVTQGYHVPRSVAFCQALGVKAVGVASAHQGRDFTLWYLLREMLATDKAVFQMILKPQPTTLEK